MNINVTGNVIDVSFDAGSPQAGTIELPDGYSYEQVNVIAASNCYPINRYSSAMLGTRTFPPVNSKSPSIFKYAIIDTTRKASFRAIIEKFGQIPDKHYFDSAFKPILVTGDDGNEYQVIPSTQFK